MTSERQRQGLEDYIDLFNRLDQGVPSLSRYVSEDVEFSDPFTRVHGRLALAEYLEFFARQVESPRFEIHHRAWDGDVCLLRWTFSGRLKGKPWRFPGVSELHFDGEGHVSRHIDHWDAARHFYRRLPLLGRVMGWIERRLHP